MDHVDDAKTVEYALCAASRLKSSALRGFAALNGEGVPVRIFWDANCGEAVQPNILSSREAKILTDLFRQVALPADLCEAVQKKFGKRFDSLEQFLTYILQELARDDAAQIDEAERTMIEQRLKDLGYL